jgi:hypothetical protein
MWHFSKKQLKIDKKAYFCYNYYIEYAEITTKVVEIVRKSASKKMDNPTIDSLVAIDPEITHLIPEGYQGNSDDPFLAELVVRRLKAGTYPLDAASPEVVQSVVSDSIDNYFLTQYTRFFPEIISDINIYFPFRNLFSTHSWDNAHNNYALNLIDFYRGPQVKGVLAAIREIHGYEEDEMDSKAKRFVTIEELERYFTLSRILRAEGFALSARKLWVCSNYWNPKEVLNLIAEGYDIHKAVDLYMIGITTWEQLQEYGDILPDSWLDDMLGRSKD